MIPKYLATLAIAVALVTLAVSPLQFATRSQVLSGTAVAETLQFTFTIEADSSHTYQINPALAQFLRTHVSLHADGPARIDTATVEIMPRDVSWTENRRTITSAGAAMTIQLKWNTPSDSANNDHGHIYLDFPAIPGMEGKTVSFHAGGYQKDAAGRYVVREMTTYRSTLLLSLARLRFALAAGLPFGILLHTIFWAFAVRSERRSRISALPPQGADRPLTFYPDPTAEWKVWLIAIGCGATVASMMAGFAVSDGFMSPTFVWIVCIILLTATAIAFALAYFTGKSLLTVRVGVDGISYARGRGNLNWLTAAWSDILLLAEKSRTYRGNTTRWIEIEFNDNRKKLKIERSIEGYSALRDLLIPAQHAERSN